MLQVLIGYDFNNWFRGDQRVCVLEAKRSESEPPQQPGKATHGEFLVSISCCASGEPALLRRFISLAIDRGGLKYHASGISNASDRAPAISVSVSAQIGYSHTATGISNKHQGIAPSSLQSPGVGKWATPQW